MDTASIHPDVWFRRGGRRPSPDHRLRLRSPAGWRIAAASARTRPTSCCDIRLDRSHRRGPHLRGPARARRLGAAQDRARDTASCVDAAAHALHPRRRMRPLPAADDGVQVTPLLRELLSTLVARPRDYEEEGSDGRIVDVLLDQIAASRALPLNLPIPASPRLLALATRILDNLPSRSISRPWHSRSANPPAPSSGSSRLKPDYPAQLSPPGQAL